MISQDKHIGLAADHAGYKLKSMIHAFLTEKGYRVMDFGTNSCESCDYPDYAHPLGKAIEEHLVDIGISICGTGNGIAMVLNKYRDVRAALCWSEEIARLARAHNDANVLSLPARFIDEECAMKIVQTFLATDFEGGRHKRRIDKIPISR